MDIFQFSQAGVYYLFHAIRNHANDHKPPNNPSQKTSAKKIPAKGTIIYGGRGTSRETGHQK